MSSPSEATPDGFRAPGVRRAGSLTTYRPTGGGRLRRWWLGLGLVLVMMVPLFVVFLADGDDDGTGPGELAVAVAARTAPGDAVGVVGVDRHELLPPDRAVVEVGATTPTEELPGLVVVAASSSAPLIARYVSDLEQAQLVDGPEGRFWLVAGGDVRSPAEAPSTTVAPSSTTAPGAPAVPPVPDDGAPDGPTPGRTAPGDPAAPGESADRGPGPGVRHVVVEGEHFWAIAEAVVTDADADAGDAEVTTYWATLVDANADILVEPGNPDLLLPGQTVQLPPLMT